LNIKVKEKKRFIKLESVEILSVQNYFTNQTDRGLTKFKVRHTGHPLLHTHR